MKGARGVMATVVRNEHITRVQTLCESVCISHRTNKIRKVMNQTILPLYMGKF